MKKKVFTTSKFIDFDKYNKIFYDNLYIDDFKIVVKMPCACVEKDCYKNDVKIEEFNLGKYTYLTFYD